MSLRSSRSEKISPRVSSPAVEAFRTCCSSASGYLRARKAFCEDLFEALEAAIFCMLLSKW